MEVVANSLYVVHMYLSLSFIDPTSSNIPNHNNAIDKHVIIEMVIFFTLCARIANCGTKDGYITSN